MIYKEYLTRIRNNKMQGPRQFKKEVTIKFFKRIDGHPSTRAGKSNRDCVLHYAYKQRVKHYKGPQRSGIQLLTSLKSEVNEIERLKVSSYFLE